MNKRVVIRVGDGNIEAGYAATVQIGNEGMPSQVETQARIPPAPDLPHLYERWQQSYWQLGLAYRLEAIEGVTNVSFVSEIDQCRLLSRQLRDYIHHWLNGEAFRPIREKILEQLSPPDTARILVQTHDPLLQRLPWYELHFFQRYRNAEVGICLPRYQQVSYQGSRSEPVRVLAVLGEADGLDTQIDCDLLNRLPKADVHFLRAPSRESFNRHLWDERGWDILFFAGHSKSRVNCQATAKPKLDEMDSDVGSGEILLNETDKLTIPQLKHALRKAIDRGLSTAIFNSCDGLGLAADLADLYIPQVLVMREPVPDEVAHAFLQGFLEAFASGTSFYGSVRDAREKLQGLESRFPCATWLPVIVQNLAEMPPTWLSLQGRSLPSTELGPRPEADWRYAYPAPPKQQPERGTEKQSLRRRSAVAITTSLLCGAAVLGGRFFGVFEPLELKLYNFLLRSRPLEQVDQRLLIITNTPADIQADSERQGNSSMSDETLSKILSQITPLNPRIIGLDIYRDRPATTPQLAEQLTNTENLIAICKIEEVVTGTEATSPPPEIQSQSRIGASDFSSDTQDGILRRHLMALSPSELCPTSATFGTQVALRYLETVPNLPTIETEGRSLGAARLPAIARSSFGGYHDVDMRGTQILLNYRIVKDPVHSDCGGVIETPAICISVSDVLTKSAAQLRLLIENRIVLIGTTDRDYGDVWATPYTRTAAVDEQAPGVFLQAQMISQLVSAAMGERSLLDGWSRWLEIVWTFGWAMAGGCIGLTLGQKAFRYKLLLGLFLAEGLLVLATWLLMVFGSQWVPLLPSAIVLPAAAFATRSINAHNPSQYQS